MQLEAIMFMLIRWSKPQDSASEPGYSNSAYLNYAKMSGSQLLQRDASGGTFIRYVSGLVGHYAHSNSAKSSHE